MYINFRKVGVSGMLAIAQNYSPFLGCDNMTGVAALLMLGAGPHDIGCTRTFVVGTLATCNLLMPEWDTPTEFLDGTGTIAEWANSKLGQTQRVCIMLQLDVRNCWHLDIYKQYAWSFEKKITLISLLLILSCIMKHSF